MSNREIKVSDYLLPGDVGAVLRDCKLLDACADGTAKHGSFFKGAIVAAAFTTTAKMLRENALPELVAEKQG